MCIELARPRACKGIVDKKRPFDEEFSNNYQHH